MKSALGSKEANVRECTKAKRNANRDPEKAPATALSLSTSSSSSSFNFLELKKHQASFLFIAWDENDTGCIDCQHVWPIINALFPSSDAQPVISQQEIREAFVATSGQSWSSQMRVTLADVIVVVEKLWESPERRTRMATSCLRAVFAAMAGAEQTVSREALRQAGKRVTGVDVDMRVVESLFLGTVAEESQSCDALDFEGFCNLLLPTLFCGH